MREKEVRFDINGGRIKVEVINGYANLGSYNLKLWDKSGNSLIMNKFGTFTNPDDDSYDLPVNNSDNDGRWLECSATVDILDNDGFYCVTLKVYQDQKELKSAIYKDKTTSKIGIVNITLKLVNYI